MNTSTGKILPQIRPAPPPSWARYVLETDVDLIARALDVKTFTSAGETFPLVRYHADKDAPCVLISQGTAGHAYVFAELGYCIYRLGYNVFIMPKHGGRTISELIERHGNALRWITAAYNPHVGIFAEGLGGFVTFYLALAGAGPVKSLICQNSPAILTERAFHSAVLGGTGAARRRRALVPLASLLGKTVPWLKVPISVYFDLRELVDPKEENHRIEEKLVTNYLCDPDFDRAYPLSAIASLVTTPPPAPLSELRVPTMFLVPTRGFAPEYERQLFHRLPEATRKKLVEVDGSVFWMVSHPHEAARTIADWFAETL
jgi:pimeloyl-ACP methyl ester carboxylesterase